MIYVFYRYMPHDKVLCNGSKDFSFHLFQMLDLYYNGQPVFTINLTKEFYKIYTNIINNDRMMIFRKCRPTILVLGTFSEESCPLNLIINYY